jgi:hypothetical protein
MASHLISITKYCRFTGRMKFRLESFKIVSIIITTGDYAFHSKSCFWILMV